MNVPPIEPPPSYWSFPDSTATGPDPTQGAAAGGELIGVGADLEPGTLLAAYRRGLFPMPLPEDLRNEAASEGMAPIGWWSPNPRGVLPLDGLIVSKSLRRSCAKFEIRVDTVFQRVMEACADPAREHGWIDDDIIAAYLNLFDMGWAHSVEVWNVTTGELAGGLYGLSIGGLFAGESMFHTETDASKVALVGLVSILRECEFTLLDVQWKTDHLSSLGVIDISRDEYLDRLGEAITTSCLFSA